MDLVVEGKGLRSTIERDKKIQDDLKNKYKVEISLMKDDYLQ